MDSKCAICWGDMEAAQAGRQPVAPGATGTEQAAPAVSADAQNVQPATADAAAQPQAAAAAPPAAGSTIASAASAEGGSAGAAMSLPCGHAFHRDCLLQWLQQCYGWVGPHWSCFAAWQPPLLGCLQCLVPGSACCCICRNPTCTLLMPNSAGGPAARPARCARGQSHCTCDT